MTSFHVRHDLTPNVARDALLLLRVGPATDTADFLSRARARDLEIGRRRSPDKVIAALRDLDFIARPANPRCDPLQLTTLGQRVADVALRDELLFAELIHMRYTWLWTPEQGGPNFSWAYQTVCVALWHGAPMPVDNDRLVATVLSAAEHEFAVKSISFSSSSVLGILHWLRALSPPCIKGGHFRRRAACPPETLLLTLEGIQHATNRPIQSPIRLSEATKDRICKATLLDEACLDEVLGQAEEAMGLVRRTGDGGDLLFLQKSAFPRLVTKEEKL